jgi:hypothetical protein
LVATNTTTGGIPVVEDGDALFDRLMGEIEPELTSSVYPTLAEKYKNETPEEKAARDERYTKATAEYEKRLAEYRTDWEASLHTFKNNVTSGLEQGDRKDEQDNMQQLESMISSL